MYTGRNDFGQVALGFTSDPLSSPQPLKSPTGAVSHLAVDAQHTAVVYGMCTMQAFAQWSVQLTPPRPGLLFFFRMVGTSFGWNRGLQRVV